MGIVRTLRRLGRKHRDGNLAPRRAVTPPELGSEMAEIERGGNRAVGLRQHRRHRIAEEMRIDDFPGPVAARDLEQPLAGPDMKPL